MEVKLVVIGGKNAGREIPVSGDKFFIGRAEDCQLRPGSPSVSRHHCVIVVEPGTVSIRDLGSSNGTHVNGQKVHGTRPLKAGDRLKIGPLEFEVQLTVSVGGKKKPKVHNVQEAAARTVESAADKELDISRWLSEDDEEEESPETAVERLPESNLAETQVVPPPSDTVAEPPKKEDYAPLFGAAQAKKPTAESSREAAADMLKQFFQNKQ